MVAGEPINSAMLGAGIAFMVLFVIGSVYVFGFKWRGSGPYVTEVPTAALYNGFMAPHLRACCSATWTRLCTWTSLMSWMRG